MEETKNFISNLKEEDFKNSAMLKAVNEGRTKQITKGSNTLGALNGLPMGAPLTITAVEIMTSQSGAKYIGVRFKETDQTCSLKALLSTPTSLTGYELTAGNTLHHDATNEDLKITFTGKAETPVGINGLPTNDFATAVVLIEAGKWNILNRKVVYYGKVGRVWKAKRNSVAYDSESNEVTVTKGQQCAMLVPVYRMQ